MKLIFSVHGVTARGCSSRDAQDGDNMILGDVQLYFASNEHVTGKVYLCRKDMCNLGWKVQKSIFQMVLVTFTLCYYLFVH